MGLETTSSLPPRVVLLLRIKSPCTAPWGPRGGPVPRTLSEPPNDRVQHQLLCLPSQKGLFSSRPKCGQKCVSSPSPFSEMLFAWVIVFGFGISIVLFMKVTDSHPCPHFARQKFPWM